MNLQPRRRYCCLLLAIICLGPASVRAGEWAERLYGYRPRVYGYVPSEYVFPRYGFKRAYVYFEGPPYGSPALGDPNHIPPCPIPPPDEMLLPVEALQPVPTADNSQAKGPSSRRIQ